MLQELRLSITQMSEDLSAPGALQQPGSLAARGASPLNYDPQAPPSPGVLGNLLGMSPQL